MTKEVREISGDERNEGDMYRRREMSGDKINKEEMCSWWEMSRDERVVGVGDDDCKREGRSVVGGRNFVEGR